MGIKHKNYLGTGGTEYTVSYKGMRGVDFSADGNAPTRERFAYLENMYRDYEGSGGDIVESIPGFRYICHALNYGRVNSLFSYKDGEGREMVVIHADNKLYRFAVDERDKSPTVEELGTVAGNKSSAFVFGSSLYVLDGESIHRIDGEGNFSTLGEGGAIPYVPTTFLNGEEYEQRNLLTDEFYESYGIVNCETLSLGSPEIEYEIISEEERTCRVKRVNATTNIDLYVPESAVFSGNAYKVVEIAPRAAIASLRIKSLHMAKGIRKIGEQAFFGCSFLQRAIISDTVEEIGEFAFAGCDALTELHLGSEVKKIGRELFASSENMFMITYSGSEEEFAEIDCLTDLSNVAVSCGVENEKIMISIPVHSLASEIKTVTLDGVSHSFSTVEKDGVISAVTLYESKKSSLNGRTVRIHGVHHGSKFTASKAGVSFMSESSISGLEAIKKCTVCESFDGRIFLSGNPQLPNTVFYSAREKNGKNSPLYFGVLNYFNDGVGSFKVRALLSVGDSIAVFKEGDDTGGSIYYHTPRETGIDILPKVYPVSYIHTGVCAVGDAISFFDDHLFISHLGLTGIEQDSSGVGKRVAVRSHNVNPKLLAESLGDIKLSCWRGYLVLMAGERFYLADSRQTFRHDSRNVEYEWYFLNRIGSYAHGTPVYRYESVPMGEYLIHERVDEEVTRHVYSTYNNGVPTYYTIEDGVKYLLYKTDEVRGGSFYRPSALLCCENDLLFFGTEDGCIYLFNSDKRGVPPDRIARMDDFDEVEYACSYANRIHSDFYSFADHAPSYVVRTVMDDCSIPNLTKSTVKNSLVAKVKACGAAEISCHVSTDKSEYTEVVSISDSALDFSDVDFSHFSFSTSEYFSVPIKEKEKGWIEKQLTLSSSKFRAPFGVCSITYRFTPKGRIKNN